MGSRSLRVQDKSGRVFDNGASDSFSRTTVPASSLYSRSSAFVLFELCLGSCCRLWAFHEAEDLFSQNSSVHFSSGLTYSYTLWSQQTPALRGHSQGLSGIQEHNKLKISYRGLVRKAESISDGILESLSAIMFFTRAHLIGAENTQKARDLREIAERIDQVQLLLKEMRSSVNSELGDETFAELPQQVGSSSVLIGEPGIKTNGSMESSPDEEKGWIKPVPSLRKSSRKVLIVPVVVRFVQA